MNFRIADRPVGIGCPPLVVAEIGINHNGDLKQAKQLVDAAADAGAEIIKHQTHIPDAEMSLEAKSVIPGNAEISIYEVISNCALTLDEERQLAEYVRDKSLIYISTPFSFEAVDFLESINVPAYKIGSGECNNYPLVESIASKRKPVIMSTGMNSIESITPSVEILREYGVPYALLHCTNLYPTPDNLIRLNSILDLKKAFPDAVLGLSDHSLTNYPCLAFPVKEEDVTIAFAFASVVAKRNLVKGHVITREDITLKRPSGGDFGPKNFFSLIGRTVVEDILPNRQIHHNQVSDG